MKKTLVLMADAHTCVRELLEVALALEGSCQVTGQMGLGADVLKICEKQAPGLLLMEAVLPDMSGAELLFTVRHRWPETRVIVLTGSKNRDAIIEVLEARPQGFVHKEEPLAVFYEVLRAVIRGSRYYSGHAVRLLDAQMQNGKTIKLTLSPRETSVLTLLARGYSSKQIAAELQLAVKTVEHYRASLMAKLNIHDVAGLTRHALSLGLVHLDR